MSIADKQTYFLLTHLKEILKEIKSLMEKDSTIEEYGAVLEPLMCQAAMTEQVMMLKKLIAAGIDTNILAEALGISVDAINILCSLEYEMGREYDYQDFPFVRLCSGGEDEK